MRATYVSEVHYGVVMHGGVALAIYTHGVANELYELARATPKADAAQPRPGSTGEVYRKLSWLLHEPALRRVYLDHLAGLASDPFAGGDPVDAYHQYTRVRFVISVIAGSSVGSINGIFLAKALANDADLVPLRRLWLQEGDVACLLNDAKSYADIPYAQSKAPPRSLLNGDRLYLKLLQALEAMDAAAPSARPPGKNASLLSDELDLYVTTMDIRGSVVPLRTFDQMVYEKRHKHVQHFQYATVSGEALVNDLRAENNPLLAFVARASASFPLAFEPMSIGDAQRLLRARPGGADIDLTAWKPYFTGLSAHDMAGGLWQQRGFGDGGYLDNRSLSYVAQVLAWRLGELPVDRKLIYVAPAGAQPSLERAQLDRTPDVVDDAISALTKIPQHEAVREDLEAVLRRNRRIERAERIARSIEADVDALEHTPLERALLRRIPGSEASQIAIPDWSGLDVADMIDYHGVAFLPYLRLRIGMTGDDIADRLAELWGVNRGSDRLDALRALVTAWRSRHYYESKRDASPTRGLPITAFLDEFDVAFQVRRASFLLRKTQQLLHLVERQRDASAQRPHRSASERALLSRLQSRIPNFDQLDGAKWRVALLVLRAHLVPALAMLRRVAFPPAADISGTAAQRQQLEQLLGMLMGEVLDAPLTHLPAATEGDPMVPLAFAAFPQPGPLQTLQEIVLQRASAIFIATDLGRRTQLQALLERDIEALRHHRCMASSIGSTYEDGPLQVEVLLGWPKLVVVPAPDVNVPGSRRIGIDIGEVVDSRMADALNTSEGRALRRLLGEYHLRFEEYDQGILPLLHDTGTGEPVPVEVVRVCPEDAPSLIDEVKMTRRKIVDTSGFSLGGFLDERWRRNDIMWGRLDGCERLLTSLLPAADDAGLRAGLLGQAHRAILREEMSEPFYAELLQRFLQALKGQGRSNLHQDFEALIQALEPDDIQNRTRMALALRAVLGDEGIADFVRQHYEVRSAATVAQSLNTAARAAAIGGQILEQREDDQLRANSRMVWLTRAGRAFLTLLAVSTPGSLAQISLRHWLASLYAIEVTAFLAGTLFGEQAAIGWAGKTFVLTAGVHVATLLAGDVVVGRSTWRRRVFVLLAVFALATMALGVVAWSHYSLPELICGRRESALDWRLCRHLAAATKPSTSQTAASGP